jgi:peptidyl-prolyl cis-trans isomerase B (cyclophilin B)
MSFARAEQVLEEDKRYRLVMETSHGRISADLDPDLGGPIPNSIAFLATKGFYDGLNFHRVVPGFVLQGGCPLGTGTGDPGYQVVGTPPRYYRYQKGDFAMAKTANAPSGASGSQFFVISGRQGEALPPEYGILGHARDPDSHETIDRIDALGTGDGPPSEPVTITSLRLEEIAPDEPEAKA